MESTEMHERMEALIRNLTDEQIESLIKLALELKGKNKK